MSRVRLSLLAMILTAVSTAWGCGDSGDSAPAMMTTPVDAGSTADRGVQNAAPALELGAGLTAFASLPPAGQPIELVMGPQGGWHIDLAVRIEGFDPGDMTLTYSARTPARSFGRVEYRVIAGRKFIPSGDAWLRSGDRVIFDITDPVEVVGQTLDIAVDLNTHGIQLTDARQILIVDEDP